MTTVSLVHVAGLPGESYPALADDGAWCWFGDPRAVTVARRHTRTFVGYITSSGDAEVAQFDHDTGELTREIVKAELQVDDHANPSLLVRTDGRLMVFYCGHRGKWMVYRTSSVAEDIGKWGRPSAASGYSSATAGYTYPNPVLLSRENDRRYVFWRGTDFLPMVCYTDTGMEWSEAVSLLQGEGVTPYVKVASDGDSTIHFALTNDHPRDEPENSVYYFRYEDGEFRRADGTSLGGWDDLPLALEDLDLVYDARSTEARAWLWDVAIDGDGRPVIVYAAFPSTEDHRYRYARWNGDGWVDSEIVEAGGAFPTIETGRRDTEPYYSGGLALDHADPSVVFLSRPVGGIFEIERWATADGGETWESAPVTSGSTANNVRPVVPRGWAEGGPRVIWMNGPYRTFTDYGTSLRMR